MLSKVYLVRRYSVQIKLSMQVPKSTGHDEDDANDHTEYAGSSVCWVANSGLIRNSAGSSLAAVLSSLSMVRYSNLQLIYSMVQCSPAYPQL